MDSSLKYTIVPGTKITGRWGQWYRHDDIVLEDGTKVGTIQTRRRYYGKRIGHRTETTTCSGGACVMGSDPRWAIRWYLERREQNPLSQRTVNIAVGVGLLALGGYALYKLASPAAAATSPQGQNVSFEPADANTITPVAVGDTVTFSMPLAQGQSYQIVMTGDSTLSDLPTKQTITSSGESDSYSVVAAGSTTVSYQLYDASSTLVSTTDFKLVASGKPSV